MRTTTTIDSRKFNRLMAIKGVNGQQLAALAGLDKSTVSRVRSGKAVDHRTIQKLGAALMKVPDVPGAEDWLA